MKKILVVGSPKAVQDNSASELKGAAEILFASSTKAAEKHFAANPDLAAIVIDGCLRGGEPKTLAIVDKFRRIRLFWGPMIAASDCYELNQKLIRAGCSSGCPKSDVPKRLREALEQQS